MPLMSLRIRTIFTGAAILLHVVVVQADPGSPAGSTPTAFAQEQYTYDNNLYRIPAGLGTQIIGANVSREDHIDTVSAGGYGGGGPGEQGFDFHILVAERRL